MASIDARCTQCGHHEHGQASENTNYVTYSVSPDKTRHGTGKAHGTERFECPTCGEETVHNRCASSVNRGS